MKQQEIMLGNYAYAFGGGDGFGWKNAKRYLAQVTSVAKWGISYDILDNKPETYHTHFEPIQLDEEWLIRLGFIKHFLFLIKDNCKVGFIDNDLETHQYSVVYNDCPVGKVQYVHQLQNLYFSLTGKPLTIDK